MAHDFNTAPTLTVSANGTSFAYRRIGKAEGTPLLLLHHLTAVLEDWDPRVVDGIAAYRPVIVFDNRGVGRTTGATPRTVEEMAEDAVAFIAALGLTHVDLLGFSLGGFIAQAILLGHPGLVGKAILAGTGPAGGFELPGGLLAETYAKAQALGKHPKHLLFFTQTAHGQHAADAFLARLQERREDRDPPVADATVAAQLAAIAAWAKAAPSPLESLTHPVFVANGDRDAMVPTPGSFELARRIPNAQLAIYPDAGHGGIFQYHELFVQQALAFLEGATA
jgi:pimeloyl-ACP methyl ester carboxylesterase